MGKLPRTCFRLPPGQKSPLHWDDSALETAIVIRPLSSGGVRYQWSGRVRIDSEEDYKPIRILPEAPSDGASTVSGEPQAVILPLNFSVSSVGMVTVTIKSERSVPPYRIVNKCTSMVVSCQQKGSHRGVA